eukprot:gene1872-1013_t
MSSKPVCKYDGKCYRKNPLHFQEFCKNYSTNQALAHPVQHPKEVDYRIFDFYNKNREGIIKENPKINSSEISKFILKSWNSFSEEEQNHYEKNVEKLSEKLAKDQKDIPQHENYYIIIHCGCSKKTAICNNCFPKFQKYFDENVDTIINNLLDSNWNNIKTSRKNYKKHTSTENIESEETAVAQHYEDLFFKYLFLKKFELCKFLYLNLFQIDIDQNQISNSNYFFISGSLNKLPLISVKNTFLNYPLTEKVYSKLKEFSSKSPFGLKEKTIFDDSIRNSFEIDSKDISISNDFDLTNSNEFEILEIIRKQLAPNSKQISAELYKMVLYEKGSHFSVHKDTLRRKNHFATLVLFVPSNYEGGEFILEHNTFKKEFDFSIQKDNELKFNWLAFYTDCDHEIKELKNGNRITLTYNLYHNEEESFNFNELKSSSEYDKIYKPICDLLNVNQNIYFMLSHFYSKSSLKPEYLKGRDLEFYLWLKSKFEIEFCDSLSLNISVISETEIPNIEENNYGCNLENPTIIHPFIEANLPLLNYSGNIGTLGNFGAEELFLYYVSCGIRIIKKL